MKKLGVLFPVLLCINLLHAEPLPAEYVPNSRPASEYASKHDSSAFQQQIDNYNQYKREEAAYVAKAHQDKENSVLAEQKRQAEYRRQQELAPSRAINACNNGNTHMCYIVGRGYQNNTVLIEGVNYGYFGSDDFKAVQFFTKACNGGDMKGCGALGSMYNEGKGTPQNKDKAAQLLTKACNANDALACNNLGVMYQNGYGMWGNKSKAKEFYNKACQLRSQAGCTNYANLNK